MRYGRVTTLLLGAMLIAAPLAAQGTPQGRMQGQRQHGDTGDMMVMPMHAMMASPAMILRLREPLELTDTQVQRIEAIHSRVQREHQPHIQAAKEAMHEAAALLDTASLDVSLYEAKLREAGNHMVLANVTLARGWVEARQVLTEEQRSNLQFGARVLEQIMAQRMRNAMEAMGGDMPMGQVTDSLTSSRRR